MIVCSPAAAASRWVNEEIKAFKTSGREGRVLALIVDGEPNASAHPRAKSGNAFPNHSLSVYTRGSLQTPAEPIAADVRPGQDSKATVRLRLIAGLIGVSFDELRQRERRRRAWRLVQGVLLLILVGLLIGAVWQGQEILKRKQRVRQAMRTSSALTKGIAVGNLMRAAVYLSHAYKLGDDSLKLRYLLARALPAIDVQAATLQEAGAPVGAVAFDPQGRYLLKLSPPSAVKVWDAVAGNLVATLEQHRASVSSAMFSHDGKHIVTASYDRTAKTGKRARDGWFARWMATTACLRRLFTVPMTPCCSRLASMPLVACGMRHPARCWPNWTALLLRESPSRSLPTGADWSRQQCEPQERISQCFRARPTAGSSASSLDTKVRSTTRASVPTERRLQRQAQEQVSEGLG